MDSETCVERRFCSRGLEVVSMCRCGADDLSSLEYVSILAERAEGRVGSRQPTGEVLLPHVACERGAIPGDVLGLTVVACVCVRGGWIWQYGSRVRP